MDFSAFSRYTALGLAPDADPLLVRAEEQNSDYESGLVSFGGQRWRIRTARITDAKPGAFLACWTRNADGRTEPFSADEQISGLLVFVQDAEHFGVFRFTAEQLRNLGITSSEAKPGKRGFRVYPSWCAELNPQARRTQRAQAAAFSVLS
ncbi:MepB family protein [Glutamicibacter sp. 287]|uniref:MepB family protein n=1 Tax=unclassified Glutamicibacter TaxID=2627139 RepID=UPI000BB6B18C|nr:MepB family protein [Glutamicibacter sp. BW80]PCC28978.1 metallopeptidase [Glutamicibacter sp. BW80]